MAEIYPPIPEPVTDDRNIITRPWTLFCQLIVSAISAAQAAIVAILVRLGVIEAWGVWQSFTPTWTSFGVVPTLGDGTLTGRVCDINKVRHVRINLTIGATTNVGTGVYAFGFPAAVLQAGSAAIVGGALLVDASTQLWWTGTARQFSTTQVALIFGAGVTQFANNVPIAALAVGDTVGIQLTLEMP